MLPNASAPTPRLKLRVRPTAETLLRGGHPWLFSDSIREQNREAQLGELAVIYDRNNAFLAIGLYDPLSPIRVRILHAGNPVTIDEAWWVQHLKQTLARRKSIIDPCTTGWRAIHGENDGWPGLVLDHYENTLVLKLYTASWLPRLPDILCWLRDLLPHEHLVLRLSRNLQNFAKSFEPKYADGQILHGPPFSENIIFQESGIKFEADVIRGQKTGFFLDQRENRRMVASLAKSRRVLNAFSFSGGFSLYAARGGATSVTDLDISTHALESAKRNFKLNASDPIIAACPHETIKADAFEWLKDSTQHFDFIILDPPSLAKREIERAEAIDAYGRLSRRGMKLLEPGGILYAASCSAHVSSNEFFGVVRQAAKSSGRIYKELQTTGHPLDHPATFPEAYYLKGIYLLFE